MTGINRARIQQEDHNDSQLVSYKMANETEGGKREEAWHPFTTRDPCASPVQLIRVVYVDRASCVTTPDVEFIFILLPPPYFEHPMSRLPKGSILAISSDLFSIAPSKTFSNYL